MQQCVLRVPRHEPVSTLDETRVSENPELVMGSHDLHGEPFGARREPFDSTNRLRSAEKYRR